MQRSTFSVYPIQIDSGRSIKKGRRFPLSLCIPNPLFVEIERALQKLGVEHTTDPTKRHPKEPFIYGRFSVEKKYGKKYVIEGTRQTILDERNKLKFEIKTEAPKDTKKMAPNNPLNLVARKKKKGKSNK